MANDKHIFIGIGGSGCQTVSQIKEKVYEKRFKEATAAKSRLQQMNDSYRFLFLDTDQRDIDIANKRNRETFEKGKVPFISPQTDLINLGRANPQAIYYEAKNDPKTLINKRILEACSKELTAKIPDQPLAFGAGAFRMKSRIAFAHALTDFQSKLQAAISGLNDVKTVGGEDCIIYYWIVGSTLGGTGSGIFNDVLYHVNQIHHQVVGNGDPQLVLTMYMPKVYIDSNATEEKYALNAFGVFTELEAFKEMSYDIDRCTVMHRLAFQNDYNLIDSNKRYCPFYYLIPVDIQTDKGTSLGTTHTMYRNTAEMLYHLHNGKAGATFRSDIDNYMNDIMERNHKDFLVPMGYVSLQKPEEQFRNYMHYRFKRDLLRYWLLNDGHTIEESKVESLKKELFRELEVKPGTLAYKISQRDELDEALASQPTNASDLNSALKLDNIESLLQDVLQKIENNGKGDKRNRYKQVLVEGIWDAAEDMIRKYGLVYTHDAIDAVRKYVAESYEKDDNKLKENKDSIDEKTEQLQKLFEKANKNGTLETNSHNKEEIRQYISALNDYVDESIKNKIEYWAHDLLKDMCVDEKNSELALLKSYIAKIKGKVTEINSDTVHQYSTVLPSKFGMAAMDVTTVYLPQLKNICDGNGWIHDNFFSSIYTTVINAQKDKDETADRTQIMNLVDNDIYNSQDEIVNKEIAKGQYKYEWDTSFDEKKKNLQMKVRFFTNPRLMDRNAQKIVDDFVAIATDVLDKKLKGNKEVQGKWFEQNVSGFFAELTNEDKDDVRRSLNPALFFSYNSNRIDVIKKEEHIVFVASSEDLAAEMLGFQKGNPKHRFEKADNDNTALVLKSKYGLSLADYRLYDSIKSVYDKATFREKYHFHHSFAQFQNKLTLNDLPDEILPQHYTFAKILLLDAFKDKLADFFFKDEEFETENYAISMYEVNPNNDQYFCLAVPEAFSINQKTGAPTLKKEDNGRKLYLEIEGDDFAVQFKKYCDLYFNYRFGETVDGLLSTLLTYKINVKNEDGNETTMTGEKVFKDNYIVKHKELLAKLNKLKQEAPKDEVRRLYNLLFTIIREEYGTVHDFIK